MDAAEWDAQLQAVAEQAWQESEMCAFTHGSMKVFGSAHLFETLHNLFLEAYKRGAKDTMITLKAMQAMDVEGKA